ncbi:MAG: YHYH protein [Planctomycetaceae bacterium]
MNFKSWLLATAVLVALIPFSASAHDWHRHADDRSHHGGVSHAEFQTDVEVDDTQRAYILTGHVQEDASDESDIARHFEHFRNVKVHSNAETLFVESNGLPDHNMMVGIRSWQQQVPLPQPYTGNNAWQIPLKPRLADKPIPAKVSLFRGAIALAVNGVPIFNALNNRGDDAFLAGELDQWGGHCGRGDDYHYHIAPVHLEDIVGKGQPIAFALDGFPIYGLTEADGSAVGELDEFNGQFDEEGNYHYHATKTFPYINGGMRGVVTVQGGQIEPQPRDSPIRPPLQPLSGAIITEFKMTKTRSVLTYRLRTQTGTVSYVPAGDSAYEFTYHEPSGKTWSETYERRAPGQRNSLNGPGPSVALIASCIVLACVIAYFGWRNR